MKIRAKATGWTVAAAAALFVAGCAQDVADSGGKETAEVQCFGVNACKGQGWISMPTDTCNAMGGTVG